jgi:hypothetical protein
MGWVRWSPVGADILLLHVIGAERPRPEAEVLADTAAYCAEYYRGSPYPSHSQACRAESDDADTIMLSVGGDLGAALAAVERAHYDGLRRRHRRVGELARTLGVASLDTAADTVDYLLAAGVLRRTTRDGTVLLVPVVPIPLPAERLALTAAEQEAEDTTRWHELYERTGGRIIGLLDADNGEDFEDRFATVTTSLGVWARRLALDVEEVRQAFLALLAAPDFSADTDLARIAEDTPFALTVDWGIVNMSRVVTPPRRGDGD